MSKINISIEFSKSFKWSCYTYYENKYEFEAEIYLGPIYIGISNDSTIETLNANMKATEIIMTPKQKAILDDYFEGKYSYQEMIELETTERNKYYSENEGIANIIFNEPTKF